MEERNVDIGQTFLGFQSALVLSGESLDDYLTKVYLNKWLTDELYSALKIRTTLVVAMHDFLENEGLINFDRISLSPITDPLAHDVEHIPQIFYKGNPYVTTHSMIYNKFLACINPNIKGVFVDSPNIRLELENPYKIQRGKYLIDFSQMDIEVRRNRFLTLDDYLYNQDKVKKILEEDYEKAVDFFERLIVYVVEKIIEKNKNELDFLDIALEVPKRPFPRFNCDAAKIKYGVRNYEIKLGEEVDSQFFWIKGLLRENYDLVYPYILKDGTKVSRENITSDMIYNYDIVAKSKIKSKNKWTSSLEILSGGIREWLYEPIIERLIDNKIISERPIIKDGNIENIDRLYGYGPFLLIAYKKIKDKPIFPETFGGGVGIERMLYTILKGTKISKIDDITFFGKNPDSHQIYMF